MIKYQMAKTENSISNLEGIVIIPVQKVKSSGCEGKKLFVKVLIRGREIGRFFMRIHDETLQKIYPESSKDQVMLKYLLLKRAGIRVPRTLRVSKCGRKFLLTDLTYEGQKILDKHSPPYQNGICLNNWHDGILSDAFDILHNALKAGVLLGPDALAIIWNPEENSPTVVLIDIFIGTYLINDKDKNNYERKISEVLDTFVREVLLR